MSTIPPLFEYRNFTISLKCTSKTELSKSSGFETGMIPVYIASGPIIFSNGRHKFDFDIPYNLDSNKNLIVEICYSQNNVINSCASTTGSNHPPVIKYMPTVYVSGLELRAPDTFATSVCNVNTSSAINEYLARPVLEFYYTDAPALPFDLKWTPGQYLSDSTIKQPLAYINKSVKYRMETYGRNGCLLKDSISVYVPQHDFYALPKDTAICFGETAPLEIRNGTYYHWFEYENGEYKSAHQSLSCDMCRAPIAKPKKTTHYKIKVGDDVFCFDTIDAYILSLIHI